MGLRLCSNTGDGRTSLTNDFMAVEANNEARCYSRHEARNKGPWPNALFLSPSFSRVPVLAESLSSVAGPWAIELPVEKYEHEAQESTPIMLPACEEWSRTLAARDYFPAVAQRPSTQPPCGVTEYS